MASSSGTNSPCAACKFLRRKCHPECVFAPYFPPDQPQKFANVHKVFGASNVTKLLNELHPSQREDAVNSLAYEADMRLRDPVYGCVGVISLLQRKLTQLQMDLTCAKSELSKYQGLTLAAATHSQALGNSHTLGFNFMSGGDNINGNSNGYYHPHRQVMFPRESHHLISTSNIDANNNVNGYDVSLLGMNVTSGTSIGQLAHQFHPHRAAGGDDRRSVDPS